jgi:hypothetical protein
MSHNIPNLQIRIHKADGSTTTFVQTDVGEVKKLLDEFQPAQIFNRDRISFTDKSSITSLPVSKITRIDLEAEQHSHLLFPVGWWLAKVQLCHGHHQYRFLVDGKPMLDPHATGIARDERGEQVSLLAVS